MPAGPERTPAEHDVENAGEVAWPRTNRESSMKRAREAPHVAYEVPCAASHGGQGSAIETTLAALLVAAAAPFPPRREAHFSGEWTGRYHEDQPDRVPGEKPGDFSGIPVNDAARRFRRQLRREAGIPCSRSSARPYTLAVCSSAPTSSPHLAANQPGYAGTGGDRSAPRHLPSSGRTIWLDGRPHPPRVCAPHLHGVLDGRVARRRTDGTTTHIKQG